MIFDLNKIPPKTLFIVNVLTIFLLLIATGYFIYEIYLMKEYGGNCIRDPLSWAENYAFEKRGVVIDCECSLKDVYVPDLELNITGGKNEG
ncbi:MAG TPA: hypothetical protein VFG01_08610 [Acidobacteriota bacterium]|nr:hypothetical protein [Acidobacteriota bacterium]